MEMDNASQKAKKAGSRKRASKACLRCRRRKVRCDVTRTSQPCTHCRLDDHSCVLPRKPYECFIVHRRGSKTHLFLRGGLEQDPDTPHQTPECVPDLTQLHFDQDAAAWSVPNFATQVELDLEGMSWDDGFVDDLHSEPEAGQSAEIRAPTRIDEHEDQSPDTPHTPIPTPTASGGETAFSSFSFLADLDLKTMNMKDSDVDSLESRGCLRVPVKPILDELVEHYFLHIHPMLPLLNEGDFWDNYDRTTNDASNNEPRFSLLLLQAMLFASCTLLYDLVVEPDHLSMAQASLLLTYWCPSSSRGPKKPNSAWLSVAIQHAKAIDADQYAAMTPDMTTMSPGEKKRHNELKRVWWCCIIRDRIMPLCVRRNTQITQNHFDFGSNPPLGYDDLSQEVERSRVYSADTKRSLVEILARMTELCVCLTDILDLVYPTRDRDMSLSTESLSSQKLTQTQKHKFKLREWFLTTLKTSRIFRKTCSTPLEPGSNNDALVLHTNLVWMYYQ
ncbi:hypothetical protein AK830_g3536 [Neonectria ditissima]|uniref:Zn(2)-C6 fungal-type domain-containing protein n=1 Tax=Neonectria ditissima TaxID=78410 RepID=A0A0N8H7X7_9HYPO|nr:hypothetical protein AK830_g3536 [Neonectria ditissima]